MTVPQSKAKTPSDNRFEPRPGPFHDAVRRNCRGTWLGRIAPSSREAARYAAIVARCSASELAEVWSAVLVARRGVALDPHLAPIAAELNALRDDVGKESARRKLGR